MLTDAPAQGKALGALAQPHHQAHRARTALLFSYFYLRRNPWLNELCLRLTPYVDMLIDSGAFSNWQRSIGKTKSGSVFTLHEYIEACKAHYHGRVWQYIALDVVKNPPATERNLQAMLDAGLTPMPVFVYPQPYEAVSRLVDINPHICVAGGVEADDRFIWQRYQKVYKADPRVRIHALGYVKWPHMFQVPIYSCDSSTWTGGQRFGIVRHFEGHKGLRNYYPRLDAKHAADPDVRSFILSHNIAPRQLYDEANWRGGASIPNLLTTFGYIQAAQFAREHGRLLFLAAGNITQIIGHAAAVACSRGARLDWPQARALYLHLNSLKGSAQVDAIVSIYERHTLWNTRHMSWSA